MNTHSLTSLALEQGGGILRLAPAWVPRFYCVPGRRIKLHPDDYYALGSARGGFDERWLSSTTPANNGPLTALHEGLSFVVFEDGGRTEKILFRDAIDELQGAIIGERIWAEHGCWPMYSKFFDNMGALPHHVHHRDEHARLVGQNGKPESYYFPPQMNNHGGDFPYTFFGIEPGTTRDQIRECLVNFTKGDNKITNLSRAYRLEPGTGWDVPPGILHAPGSLCTYEPQRNSDVYAMYQSLTGDQLVQEELLWKDCPADRAGDFDYLVEVLDWEANVDPEFVANHFMRPKPVRPPEETPGYVEKWISYRSPAYSAKELTVLPGQTVTVTDAAAYGVIFVQGHGRFGNWQADTPTLIRYGQLTSDEFFVTEAAARSGVVISNPSLTDPLVMLKHFGPGNPDLVIA
ncbi:MAG: hypothetical protein BGO12_03330 [Verrucomicrobia bacterium 61-8]|nr:hypothetical protein [Verrucomicrobiota bacterium]OJV22849.1 MAG: hypothetical protein BGO12_03330 [Verrucomicrobia bacterium 61-8]